MRKLPPSKLWLVDDPQRPELMERVACYLVHAGVDFHLEPGDRLPTEVPADVSGLRGVVVLQHDALRHRDRLLQFQDMESLFGSIAYQNSMLDCDRDARWPWLWRRHRHGDCRLALLHEHEARDERRLESRVIWPTSAAASDPLAARRLQARSDEQLFDLARHRLLKADSETFSAWNDSTFLAWLILFQTWQRTGDRSLLEVIGQQCRVALARGLPEVCCQDDAAPSAPLMLVARELGDPSLYDLALQRLQCYMNGPRFQGALTCYHGEQWVRTDALGIIMPATAIAAAITGERTMWDAAWRTVEIASETLPRTDGLPWSQSTYQGQVTAPWGRGMAWAVFGLSLALTYWPCSDPRRLLLIRHFQELARRFIPFQDDNGYWHQVLDEPESAAESSCTYLVTRSLLWGIGKGVLDESYRSAAMKGWNALKARCFAGLTVGVVEATSVSTRRQYYRDRRLNTVPRNLILTARFVMDIANQLAAQPATAPLR
jgi:rhamnogalacturonyl hydrolase YesR